MEEFQRYVIFLKSLVNHIFPDIVNMRINGIQKVTKSTVMELIGRDAKSLIQYCLSHPISHFVEWTWRHETVKSKYQSYRTFIHISSVLPLLGGTRLARAVAVDNGNDIQALEYWYQYWDST